MLTEPQVKHRGPQVGIWAAAIALIIAFATICFAGSSDGIEDLSKGVNVAIYGHGWPWTFCVRVDDERYTRFLFWHGNLQFWRSRALVGNAAVFAVATVLVIAAARGIALSTKRTYSLRSWLVLVSLVCVGAAWGAFRYRQGKADFDAEEQLQHHGSSLGGDYRPPQWLTRLTGSRIAGGLLFYRLGDTLEIGLGASFDPAIIGSVMAKQPRIERVIFHYSAEAADVRKVLQQPWMSDVERLSFSGTSTTDRAISGLVNCRSLKILGFYHTDLSDEGLRAILSCRQLESIELCFTDLTDAGLRSLEELPTLKRVYITEVNISAAAVDRLRKRGIEVDTF